MTGSSPEFDAAYDRICSRWTDDAMTGLTTPEREFLIATVCLNQSLNGGLMMYYENTYGTRASEAAEVLGRIGLPAAAALLKRANELMGAGGPSTDEAERALQLEALSDAALQEMGECSDALNEMAEAVRLATLRWLQGSSRV